MTKTSYFQIFFFFADLIVVKSLPAQVVGRRAVVREVEGLSVIEKNSAPISVLTEEIIVIVVLGFHFC